MQEQYQRGAVYMSEQTAMWKQVFHQRSEHLSEIKSPCGSFRRQRIFFMLPGILGLVFVQIQDAEGNAFELQSLMEAVAQTHFSDFS